MAISLTPYQSQSIAWLLSRSLLVCCGAYRRLTTAQRRPNLTPQKISKMAKDRCEWAHDDYSLNVGNLPTAQKVAEVLPPKNDLFAGDVA